jgi:serine/threonine protein kinase
VRALEHERLIGARYRLKNRLGCGGMGSVWEAEDAKLQRRVAIKLMLSSHAGDEAAVRRFEREAMAIARLRSPHIAQVHDYGVDDGRPYMVMELLAGETLTERLRKVGRLGLTQAGRLARHLGKALAAAHALGIVHRDLKPGNVFLVDDYDEDLTKLFDFGISRALEPLRDGSLTRENHIVGTPRFMSPEQMAGAPVDHRTDLWSFGVTLYCACTGHLPFRGDDLRSIIKAVAHEPHALISEVTGAALPRGLDRFFARALAKRAGDRFRDARQMADAFVAIAAPHLRSTPPPALVAEDIDRTRRIVPPPLPRRARRRDAQPITMTLDEPRPRSHHRAAGVVAALSLCALVGASVLATPTPRIGTVEPPVAAAALASALPLVPTAKQVPMVTPLAQTPATRERTRKTNKSPTATPKPRPARARKPKPPVPSTSVAPQQATSAAPTAAASPAPQRRPHKLFEEPW